MNKAGEFSQFMELLFRWETDKRGKRIRRIIADYATGVKGSRGGE